MGNCGKVSSEKPASGAVEKGELCSNLCTFLAKCWSEALSREGASSGQKPLSHLSSLEGVASSEVRVSLALSGGILGPTTKVQQ